MTAKEMRDIVNTEIEKRYDEMFPEYVEKIKNAIRTLAMGERTLYTCEIGYKDKHFYQTRIIPYFKSFGFDAKIIENLSDNDELRIYW